MTLKPIGVLVLSLLVSGPSLAQTGLDATPSTSTSTRTQRLQNIYDTQRSGDRTRMDESVRQQQYIQQRRNRASRADTRSTPVTRSGSRDSVVRNQ